MTSVQERLTGRPDVFGRVETGSPGTHAAPGPHGLRIENYLDHGVYVVRAELPGVDFETHAEITIDGTVLTLRAERGGPTSREHRARYCYGSYARSVLLPAGAKGAEATAEYEDGVLTVRVPVLEERTNTRTVPVRHA